MTSIDISSALRDDLFLLSRARKNDNVVKIAVHTEAIRQTLDRILASDISAFHFDDRFYDHSMEKLCIALTIIHHKLSADIKAFLLKLQHQIRVESGYNIIAFVAARCDAEDILFYLSYVPPGRCLVPTAYKSVLQRKYGTALDLDTIESIIVALWANSYAPPHDILTSVLHYTKNEAERLKLYDVFIKLETNGISFIRSLRTDKIDSIYYWSDYGGDCISFELVKKICEYGCLPSNHYLSNMFFRCSFAEVHCCYQHAAYRLGVDYLMALFDLFVTYYPAITDFFMTYRAIANRYVDFYTQTKNLYCDLSLDYLLQGIDDNFSVRIDEVTHLKMYGIRFEPAVQSFHRYCRRLGKDMMVRNPGSNGPMANQNLFVNILPCAQLSYINRLTSQLMSVRNSDKIATEFPKGLHIVSVDGEDFVIENASLRSRVNVCLKKNWRGENEITSSFPVKLTENTGYVSKKGISKPLTYGMEVYVTTDTEIELPTGTILQKQSADDIVTSIPLPTSKKAIYRREIDAGDLTFMDLCKPVADSVGKITIIGADQLVHVMTPDGKIVQTVFIMGCTEAKISPNGRYICMNRWFMHDLHTRKTRYLADAICVCFSANSQKIAYRAGAVHIQDLATEQVTMTINTPSAEIAFHSDNKHIAIGSSCKITIYDIETGQAIAYRSLGFRSPTVIRPAGNLICYSNSGWDAIRVWDPSKKWFSTNKIFTNKMYWTVSGTLLATCHHYMLNVIDITSKKVILRTHHHNCSCDYTDQIHFAFSPDNQYLMVNQRCASVIYQISDGSKTVIPHQAEALAVCFA